jgi:hypothetical protein
MLRFLFHNWEKLHKKGNEPLSYKGPLILIASNVKYDKSYSTWSTLLLNTSTTTILGKQW